MRCVRPRARGLYNPLARGRLSLFLAKKVIEIQYERTHSWSAPILFVPRSHETITNSVRVHCAHTDTHRAVRAHAALWCLDIAQLRD